MELNIDSREVPEFKSLTLLKFITLLSLNSDGSFIVLKLVKKSNVFFIYYIMHIAGKIIYLRNI